MMCRLVQRRLPLYTAGLLNEREAWRVEAHLAACTACREEVGLYLALDSAILAARVLPDAERTRALLAQLELERTWRRWSGRFLQQTLLQLAGILIAGSGIYAILTANLPDRVKTLAGEAGIPATFTTSATLAVLFVLLLVITCGVLFAMHRLLERA
jgi:anti-sigma factor RsiW